MKCALRLTPLRSLAGRHLGGLGFIRRTPERCVAGADDMRPRDDQRPLRWGVPPRPYAPGGVFDPLFAGLLVDAAGIRAATLGRFGSPYARFSKPAAPTAWRT
jgi:hypothetical protein